MDAINYGLGMGVILIVITSGGLVLLSNIAVSIRGVWVDVVQYVVQHDVGKSLREIADASKRSATALERIATVLERTYPIRVSVLPNDRRDYHHGQ